MKRPIVNWRLLALAVLALAAVLWVLHDESPASWVRVEGPGQLTAGSSADIAITLNEPPENGFVMCDIHAVNPADPTLRVVASDSPQPIVSGKTHYTFSLVIPAVAGLSQARYVVYLSPSVHWKDHRIVATSKRYPIVMGEAVASESVPVPVFTQVHDPGTIVPDHRVLRWLTSIAWIGCAVLAAVRSRSAGRGRLDLVWIVIFLGLAAWELSAAGTRLAEFARSLARSADLYEERRAWQQLVTAAVVALAAVVLAFALQRSRAGMPFAVLAGVALFGIVSFATTLSLHEIDHLMARTVLGIPSAAALRFGASAVALAGLVRGWRSAGPAAISSR